MSLHKKAIPVVGFMAVHNGADFIRQSIESVMPILDKLVVIEGAWGENVAVNGQKRSTDGTIAIVQELQESYPGKIDLWQYNDPNQLIQRNRIFDHIPSDCWLFIVDHDEVWDQDNLGELWRLLQQTDKEAIKVKSLTFINDPHTYSPIAFPRCFRIQPGRKYHFCAPNDLICDGRRMDVSPYEDIIFFHYSYCHSPFRFMEKKRERTHLHGHFPWELDGNRVVRKDANIQNYDGDHPETMAGHPIMSRRPVHDGDHYVIVQHSGIGNLIHLTPLCLALRELYPRARISILTWKRSSRILEDWPVVDDIWTGTPAQFFATLKQPPKEVMLSPVGTLPGPYGGAMKLKFDTPWIMHESEYHMLFVREIGWGDREKPSAQVQVNQDNFQRAQQKILDSLISSPFLAVNACYLKSDHWPKKHWGNHNYAELLAWFAKEYGWPVVFVGSEADKRDAQEIIREMDSMLDPNVTAQDVHNFCGWSDDIKDTAALLSMATVTLGNDGGLQHISTAVDTPTVTVFTFTNHLKNQPEHPLSEIAMKDCDNRLMCQHGGHRTCQCLDVPIDLVKSALEKVISRAMV